MKQENEIIKTEKLEIHQFEHEGIIYCCRGSCDAKVSNNMPKCDFWDDTDDYFYAGCILDISTGYDPARQVCPQPGKGCPGIGLYERVIKRIRGNP